MRLHIDHIGPFLGKYFLVVVDAHSKWIKVVTVPSTSTQHTIRQLRLMLATYGLPKIIVSDNATGFTSAEFQEFVTRNRIRHITSAPYHPATNGLAERAVQTFKNAMRKDTPTDSDTAVAQFLFHYRNTPHSTTGATEKEEVDGQVSKCFSVWKACEDRVLDREIEREEIAVCVWKNNKTWR